MPDLIARPDIIWAYQFRIILLGDSTVGKSALLRRFTDGHFYEVGFHASFCTGIVIGGHKSLIRSSGN